MARTTVPQNDCEGTAIIWFRRDLRLADHEALQRASRHDDVLPLYILQSQIKGTAAEWWLLKSLASLDESLRTKGSRLIFRSGEEGEELLRIAKETKATVVYASRRYEPHGVATDNAIKGALEKAQVRFELTDGDMLRPPALVTTKAKTPYSVFTAYYKAVLALGDPDPPLPVPKTLTSPKTWPRSLDLPKLAPHLANANFAKYWAPGENSASTRLKQFVKTGLTEYPQNHDLPAVRGTSGLSPHLAFGEISPRQVWHKTGAGPAFRRQLVWRDFARYLLSHHPNMSTEPLNAAFANFEWDENPAALEAWQRGFTGYPLVDAGMRELLATGSMHNRVRMVVASFLVKHLLLPWQLGAEWFFEHLLDADEANNSQNWQWCAGSGVDAAPYFRVFNPTLQGERFDTQGDYVRTWVPELAKLSRAYIHKPWSAPASELERAGIKLGKTYPAPIVEHGAARLRALVRYERMRREVKKNGPRGPHHS